MDYFHIGWMKCMLTTGKKLITKIKTSKIVKMLK